jgi:hypothetical protein
MSGQPTVPGPPSAALSAAVRVTGDSPTSDALRLRLGQPTVPGPLATIFFPRFFLGERFAAGEVAFFFVARWGTLFERCDKWIDIAAISRMQFRLNRQGARTNSPAARWAIPYKEWMLFPLQMLVVATSDVNSRHGAWTIIASSRLSPTAVRLAPRLGEPNVPAIVSHTPIALTNALADSTKARPTNQPPVGGTKKVGLRGASVCC